LLRFYKVPGVEGARVDLEQHSTPEEEKDYKFVVGRNTACL